MAEAMDPLDFRNAMSRFASGVTIVTTLDAEQQPVGFTASAFSSLSLDPPLVLVCLDEKAESARAFRDAETIGISILSEGQTEIAMRFAKRGADKFGGGGLSPGEVTNVPLVQEALAQVECRVEERLPGGDHMILVGRVVRAAVDDGLAPMVHYNRAFGEFVAKGG